MYHCGVRGYIWKRKPSGEAVWRCFTCEKVLN